MKHTLIGSILLLEAAVLALLLFLHLESLPDKTGLTLVRLLPIAFGLHVLEEFGFPGGFSDWYKGQARLTSSLLLSVLV
jgi:hypothetical protein